MAKDEDAFEVLRVWVQNDGADGLGGNQFVVIPTWNDPAYWGILLVDIARHVAKSYEAAGLLSEERALKRVYELFQAEWNSPTDVPKRLQ